MMLGRMAQIRCSDRRVAQKAHRLEPYVVFGWAKRPKSRDVKHPRVHAARRIEYPTRPISKKVIAHTKRTAGRINLPDLRLGGHEAAFLCLATLAIPSDPSLPDPIADDCMRRLLGRYEPCLQAVGGGRQKNGKRV